MDNPDLVDHWAALFERQCVPLDQDRCECLLLCCCMVRKLTRWGCLIRVLSTSVVSSMGAGISDQRKELWNVVEDESSGGFFSATPGHLFVSGAALFRLQYALASRALTMSARIAQGNRFMTMSMGESPPTAPTLLSDFERCVYNFAYRRLQICPSTYSIMDDYRCRKLAAHQKSDRLFGPSDTDCHSELTGQEASRSIDVFFWDGTQHVASLSWKKRSGWDDDATSLTENSSTDDSDIFGDSSDVWSLPRSSGWESVGDRQALPHVRLPSEHGAHQSLESLTIPIEVACRTARARPTVQVHADDIIEV